MNHTKGIRYLIRTPILVTAMIVAGLTACSSEDDENKVGYLKLYNASANSPGIFLTVDQDLNTQSEDDDDVEITYSGVTYGKSSGKHVLDAGDYFVELAWQDQDSAARDDLEMVYQGQVNIARDSTEFIVISDDILTPQVLSYSIPLIEEDSDDDNDLFNIRFLNMNSWPDGIEIYLSKSDQSFNQAQLIGQLNYTELSDNQKFEQDNYKFYLTSTGSDEILYQSAEISYSSSSQYIMAIRANSGVDSSPFILDKISNSTTVEYKHDGSQAQFRVFNAIKPHHLLPDYQGAFDVYLNGIDDAAEISSLSFGAFSEPVITDSGDYSVELTMAGNRSAIVENHLLTLSKNSDRTVFFYLAQQNVDEDNDGNVDEDSDGYVDEIEINVNSLLVETSQRESIFDHEIKIINLVDSKDFDHVGFYFVRSDELIATAAFKRNVAYATAESIVLRNNSYTLYAIAQQDNSDSILATFELVLDPNSPESFVIFEKNDGTSSDYNMVITSQTDDSSP